MTGGAVRGERVRVTSAKAFSILELERTVFLFTVNLSLGLFPFHLSVLLFYYRQAADVYLRCMHSLDVDRTSNVKGVGRRSGRRSRLGQSRSAGAKEQQWRNA